MSKESYKDQKLSLTASNIFFAKYYDDLKKFFAGHAEIEDVFISFDRKTVNLDLKFFQNYEEHKKPLNIQFELQRKILSFCNQEKVFNSINYGTAAEYTKNPISFKNLALLKFSEDGRLLLFKQALKDGADYNYVFKNDWGTYSNITPLFLAAYNDHKNIAEHIITLADEKGELEKVLNHRNTEGFSAFTIAYYMGSVSVAEFLFSGYNEIITDLSSYKELSEKYILRSFNEKKVLINRSQIDNVITNTRRFYGN